MPIVVRDDDRTASLTEEQFRDERELQRYLELYPYLLVSSSEPEVVAVRSEVGLPAAGSLDLLLVDQEGVPVAVEVELARNSQSRREVVAQAFDYVSDLNQLTIYELDDVVDGALMERLGELEERTGTEGLLKQCGTNLRAGNIRLVIAVDEASSDLVRIIQYINDHSDLDVRLVAVSKFSGGAILVPRILVSGGRDQRIRATTRRDSKLWLAPDLREAYLALSDEGRGRRLHRFLDWAVDEGSFIQSRAKAPTFGLKSKGGDRILTINLDGKLFLHFGAEKYPGGIEERDELAKALSGLQMIDPEAVSQDTASGRYCTRTLWELSEVECEELLDVLGRFSDKKDTPPMPPNQ